MNELITVGSSVVTMTSLEMVEFINSQRKSGEAVLVHSDFLKKVPAVLGGVAGKFSSYYTASNGKRNPCYRFPKREACLMAMSYSYELQAKVFDRMTGLEGGKVRVPQTLPEALRLAADLAEKNAQQAELIEKQKPAVEFVQEYVEGYGTTPRCPSGSTTSPTIDFPFFRIPLYTLRHFRAPWGFLCVLF